MKKVMISAAIITLGLAATAQDFPGYRTGNYAGVNSVFFNPASIADSRYRFDINLISFSEMGANDQLSYKLKDIGKSFNGDSISNRLFGKNAGPASSTSTLDIHGPSVMFNVGKKTTIAITTRVRAIASIVDLDGKLASNITDDFNSNVADLPYTISSAENMRIAINAWSEFGVSIGRELFHEGAHKIKGGISLKYLSGTGNGYLNIDHFNGKIDKDLLAQDAYLSNSSGRLALGFGGIDINDLQSGDVLKKYGSGLGIDLGAEYEFNPDGEAEAKPTDEYLLKIGVAVLDMGKIKYHRDMQRSGDYNIDITGNERLYLSQLQDVTLDDYNQFFASRPQYFTPAANSTATTYSVSLPTTLQVYADYHVSQGFYLHLGSQMALANNDSKIFNNHTYSGLTLTPRFESRVFGFYMPLNYNSLSKFNAGASFRVGPVFFGSGCILSALASHSKQIDLHLGVRFGGLK